MVKTSAFFDLFNRHRDFDLEEYLRTHSLDDDYILWNGYLLPNDFGNPEAEYHAIRNGCAMFDPSPIRKYRFRGDDAGAFLDHLVTRPVSSSPSMRGIYVALCHEDGFLKDDAILYKFTEDDYLLMPSEIDHGAHLESLREKLGLVDVSIEDCKDSLSGVSLQGPLSATVLHRWGFDGILQLDPFEVKDFALGGGTVRISRMGFTADLGYECWFAPELYDAFEAGLLAAGEDLGIDIRGYGITGMEASRIEGGFIVPGWDCATEMEPNPDLERTPYELALGWLVKLDAVDFVGRDALREKKMQGHRFVLRGFLIESRVELGEEARLYTTSNGEDVEIGTMPCHTWSWGLDRRIGNASIRNEYRDLKEAWTILDGERHVVVLKRGALVDFARRTEVPAPIDASLGSS